MDHFLNCFPCFRLYFQTVFSIVFFKQLVQTSIYLLFEEKSHIRFSHLFNRNLNNPHAYIGLGKKKCRICDRNLTLYLTYLELSDFSQICAVLFANLLSFRRQRHYPALIKTPLLICKTLRQPVFASLF